MAPAMKPRTVCRCQPMTFIISEMVAPLFRRSMPTTWALLLPSRNAAAFLAWVALSRRDAFLAGVAFVVAFPLAGAILADCAPTSAFLAAFGLAGGSGCAGMPSL